MSELIPAYKLTACQLAALQRLARFMGVRGADSGDKSALAERVATALSERRGREQPGYVVRDRRAR